MIVRLLRLLVPERRLWLGVLLQVATLLFGVLLLGSSAWLIAKAALRPSIGALHVAIAGVRFFGLARAVSRYLERLVSHDAALRWSARLRGLVFQRLLPLPPLRGQRSGDLLARLIGDVAELENAPLRVLGPSLAALGLFGLLAGFLLLRHGPGFALLLLAAAALGGLVAPALAGWLSRVPGQRLVRARAELQASLTDGVQGVADLLAFGGGAAHVTNVARLADTVEAQEARLARASAAGGALSALSGDLAALALLALAVPAVRAGHLDGLQFAVLPLLALAAFEAVGPLAAAYRTWGSTREAARRVFELIDAPPAIVDPELPEAAGPGKRLELRGTTFHYPDGTLALHAVDLELSAGRLVAVVGPSGSGKSTLLQVLLRFQEPTAGQVLLDGVDVRRLAAEAVRERLAVASPREHLFAGSLRENLLLARPGATDEQLAEALAGAGLGDFCAALPEGLATWVGEQGVLLSGGERQRLLLARALLKNAPVLLLDEPTAHLDGPTARQVLAGLLARRDRAVLLLTHRLAGLETADEIVVLDRGRVVERGTWAELVGRGGRFARSLAAERSELG